MRAALWPNEVPDDLADPVALFAGREEVCFVWEDADGRIGGFAEASLRRHAAGCTTSPVGFLEAWYVAPELRRKGIGAALVATVEAWVLSKGCTELGSDADLANGPSRRAHAALGFAEIEETVQFAKRLADAPGGGAASPGRDANVSLRSIDESNVRAVCDLAVTTRQTMFVAPNAVSLAQAYTTTDVWVRAVYADETPVGFVMLSDDAETARYYLWRFMIDRRYQRLGFGRRAMAQVENYVSRRPGGERLYLSYVPAPDGPGAFYSALGYVDTGRVHGGELEAVKHLDVAGGG